ncbi:MAG: hypothetical protein GXP62_15890 [Oligoflexia bacterium]|nr:hypothetical protein [Oligoflexia bacterium]
MFPSLRSTKGRQRQGETPIGAVAFIMLVLLIAAGYIAWALVPVWMDYLKVQEISRTVVLDWANHENLRLAKARFNAELHRKDVSESSVVRDDCDFVNTPDAWEVDCVWTQVAYYPGTKYFKSFPLRVHVRYEDGKAVLLKD